jgi:type VI secretion system protein ImpA
MATPETVEIAPLLEPISAEQPSGESLIYDKVYDQLKEAARGGSRNQLEEQEKAPDWGEVLQLATTALATRSKDLTIAAWLTEALTSLRGFAGLRDGLRVIRGLQENFWNDLHPQLDEGDMEARAGRLSYLNDSAEGSTRASLGTAIAAIPLTPVDQAEGRPFGYTDFRESREVDNLARIDPEKHKAARDAHRLTGEQFDAAVARGRRGFYEPVYADANEALEECQRLQALVAERFGKNAPSLLNVHKAIEDSRDLLWRIVQQKREQEPDAVVDDIGATAEAVSVGQAQPAGPLRLEPRDRADAVRRLAAVAAFFRRTEPHNPVAYLVERAMRWAEMPLEAWLHEVLADDATMARLRDLLGIKHEP